jgi:hypothetical protein
MSLPNGPDLGPISSTQNAGIEPTLQQQLEQCNGDAYCIGAVGQMTADRVLAQNCRENIAAIRANPAELAPEVPATFGVTGLAGPAFYLMQLAEERRELQMVGSTAARGVLVGGVGEGAFGVIGATAWGVWVSLVAVPATVGMVNCPPPRIFKSAFDTQ